MGSSWLLHLPLKGDFPSNISVESAFRSNTAEHLEDVIWLVAFGLTPCLVVD